MSTKPEFSDEELTAYLDGEVEYVNLDAINKALANDPELRRRMDALIIDREEIRSAFDELLASSPKPDMSAAVQAKKSQATASWPKLGRAVAAVLIVAVSFGIGWKTSYHLDSTADQGWRHYAAVYQALYINSTLSHIQRPDDEKTVELERVSAALGKELSLQSLVANKQLDYKRAQILGFMGQPLIQLAFLSSVDVPVALCIMRSGVEGDRPVSVTTMEGMSAASWDKDGYSYLLIGGSDDLLIKEFAGELAMYL